jgi:superfamily I DNA/RNA helicase
VERVIWFGPPGCGKTYTLLQQLEAELKNGVSPERIAFLTFTRRARREALERVEKVLGIEARELPYFRTIHSMAFRALKLSDGDVLGYAQLKEFGAAMGLTFGQTGATEFAAEGIQGDEGDALLALDNLARLRGQSLKECWQQARTGVAYTVVDYFSRSYVKYKKEIGLLDFTDVLLEFVRAEIMLPVDVMFVDEAQDLSALQWLAVLQAGAAARAQFVAGDEDQAIYDWCGADVKGFMSIPGARQVLGHSYRLPRRVHALATAVSARIKLRIEKKFTPRDAEGRVVRHPGYESIKIEPSQKWLWLVRNRYLLPPLQGYLQRCGIVYSQHGVLSINERECEAIYDWERLRAGHRIAVPRARALYKQLTSGKQVARGHKLLPGVEENALVDMKALQAEHGLLAPDATWFDILQKISAERRAYYRMLLRAHRTLKLKPQVQLETIHGAKGAEAPHVALFLEQSRRVWDEAQEEPDSENRVLYVAVSRAEEELHVVLPSGRWGYELPAFK